MPMKVCIEELSTCDDSGDDSDGGDCSDFPPGWVEAPPGLEANHQETVAETVARMKIENAALRVKAENMRLANENALLRQKCLEASMVNAVAENAKSMSLGQPGGTNASWSVPTTAPVELGATSHTKEHMIPEAERTTVMFRNLPSNFTRAQLVNLLNFHSFEGCFNFIYLPVDFKSNTNLGYVFVNLTTPRETQRFWQVFNGFADWGVSSQKTGKVCWSNPHQGYEEHVERFRNSPVMHEAVPDDHRPLVFKDGIKVPFPAPTKKLRVPRLRPNRGGDVVS